VSINAISGFKAHKARRIRRKSHLRTTRSGRGTENEGPDSPAKELTKLTDRRLDTKEKASERGKKKTQD
jgi:hypothetical protein